MLETHRQYRGGFESKDCEQFRELAHALKGAAMMTGAIRLRDSAARAEKITDSDFNRGTLI